MFLLPSTPAYTTTLRRAGMAAPVPHRSLQTHLIPVLKSIHSSLLNVPPVELPPESPKQPAQYNRNIPSSIPEALRIRLLNFNLL